MPESEAAQEPTMEEILASIRRIISEDHGDREQAQVAPEDSQTPPEDNYDDDQEPEPFTAEQFHEGDHPADAAPGSSREC